MDNVLFDLPKSWIWTISSEVCSSVRDGTHDTPIYVEKGIPLVTSKNLSNGTIDFSYTKHISENDHEEISKRSAVDSGDVLFAMLVLLEILSLFPNQKNLASKISVYSKTMELFLVRTICDIGLILLFFIIG